MRIRGVPTFRHACAVTGLLLLAACARTAEPAPSAPAAAPEPAPSAAPPPPAAEAAAPAAAPSPNSPSSLKELESAEQQRDEGFAKPADKDELGQAVAELERARAELEGAFAKQKARPSSAPSGGATASRGADLDQAPAKADKKGAESSCGTACRAFSSLGRAASAVCRLAGEKDARCTHAHHVVADAEKRVAVCGCHPE
jgi:hypothetical protein